MGQVQQVKRTLIHRRALLAGALLMPFISRARAQSSASWRSVASGCALPTTRSLTNKQTNSQSRHQIMAPVSAIRVVVPNFFGTNPEAALGGTTTVTLGMGTSANGPFVPLNFSGSLQGTVGDNTILVSDITPLPASLANTVGGFLFLRMFFNSVTGITFITFPAGGATAMDVANGEAMNFAVSGLNDLTLGGTIVNSSVLLMVRPAAIIGYSSIAAPIILADSRGFGQNDGYANGTTNAGDSARGIGLHYPYIMLAQDGGSLSNWVGRVNANQVAISKFGTHFHNALGINDIVAGSRSAVQLTQDYVKALAFFPRMPASLQTLMPETTSTNSWSALSDQTVSANNSVRVAWNDQCRNSGVPGYGPCVDVGDIMESSRDSGLIIVNVTNPTANYGTNDGVHQSPLGCQLIQNADLFRGVFT